MTQISVIYVDTHMIYSIHINGRRLAVSLKLPIRDFGYRRYMNNNSGVMVDFETCDH